MNGQIVSGKVVLAGVLLAAAAMGCRGGSAGLEVGAMAPGGDGHQSKFVVVNNESLGADVQVVDAKSEYAGDLLMAQVNLVSKSSKTQRFQYQFAWFNGNGIEVDAGKRPWTPVVLYGNESKTLQGLAPNPSVKEFKIKIRSM